MKLILTLFIHLMVYAQGRGPCQTALEIKGVKTGGLGVFYRVGICEKKKNLVLTEVSFQAQPKRTISFSRSRFDQITNGVKSTLIDVKAMKSPVSPCRHIVEVHLDWEGAKDRFSSCDQDRLSLLVLKLSNLVEDIYSEK